MMKPGTAAVSAADIFDGGNFDWAANTMTNSRHGSHRKLLVEFAVIGLAHRGHVMGARTLIQDDRS